MFHASQEAAVAVGAVLRASSVARVVFDRLVKDETATKSDASPVTVADYSAQALVSTLLFHYFPKDQLVGEEDATDLRSEAQTRLRDRVVGLANDALRVSDTADGEWKPIGTDSRSADAWLAAIDKGNATHTHAGRTWALDPIDGTKGFLRGGQYAICLALLRDGLPVLGVVGCPNLPVDHLQPEGEKGVLFIAEAGRGAFMRSFSDPLLKPVAMRKLSSLSEASFCESVEGSHSDQGTNARIAAHLGITKPPVRMDSQAKYCSIARGDGDVYLRLPAKAGYVEKIWDHAAGALLVDEAGGTVTDMNGKPLDFSLGRTLAGNVGIVAAERTRHAEVLLAVQKAVSESRMT